MKLRYLRRRQLAKSFDDSEKHYYLRWWRRNGGITAVDISQLMQSDPDYRGVVMNGEIGTLYGFTITSDTYRPPSK